MSIKPQYVKQILLGKKKYEFRKRLANQECKKIIIYSTSPEKQIVGEVKVTGTIEMAPSTLWEKTKKDAGISRKKYREYFKDCSRAYAYELGEVTVYSEPIELGKAGVKVAPQSFVYLTEKQYEKMFE